MSLADDQRSDVDPVAWRTIFRHSDPAKVEAVWLAIQSMEYPARLLDGAGPIPVHESAGDETDGDRPHGDSPEREPTHVEVHAEHADELAEVIDEIVGEQDELDAAIDRLVLARQRRQRVIVAVIVVGFFAVLLSRRLFA